MLQPNTFESPLESALSVRAFDLAKNGKVLTMSALVPNALSAGQYGTAIANMRIDTQGGFMLHGISGRALGPVDATGVRATGSTIYPAAGSGTGGTGYPAIADRGVSLRMQDENGKVLTNRDSLNQSALLQLQPKLQVGNIIGCGYGFEPYYVEFLFPMYFPALSVITFHFENSDVGTDGDSLNRFHRVDIMLVGERYVR